MWWKAWDEVDADIEWRAPDGLYWIYGRTAYSVLPLNWSGSYELGSICPSFFLLSLTRGEHLRIWGYKDWKPPPKKKTMCLTNWQLEGWRMAPWVYNPLPWSSHLDRGWILWIPYSDLYAKLLQAVVEIITNKTAKALNILAKQQPKMRNAIYQNHLALDNFLAAEGGVCGKFNLSNSCFQIDNEGKVIEEITDQMRKITHVPVQTWRGWNPQNLGEGF